MFRKIILIFSLLTSFNHFIFTQTYSTSDIKAMYIIRFSENIVWPNYKVYDSFRIAIDDSDSSLLKSLKYLTKGNKIHSKPVSIYNIGTSNGIYPPHILYISYDRRSYISQVQDVVKKQSILLVSDDYKDKQKIMINFITDNENNRINFELNKENINTVGLDILPELLLLGGKILDIKELYKKTEKSVQEEKIKVKEQKKLIDEQKKDIEIQIKIIKEQENEIVQKEKILASLDEVLNKKEQLIIQGSSKLYLQQQKIVHQENLISYQKNKIDSQHLTLDTQLSEIKEKKEIISSQDSVINNQKFTISNQKKLLYISYGLLIGLVLLGIVILRNNIVKQKIFKHIENQKKQIEEQHTILKEQATELNKTNNELESFSYSVSHDLRAPLRSINGFTQALIDDYLSTLDEQAKNYLSRIKTASQKMSHLIDDLLKLSRINRLEVKKEEINLSDIANAFMEDMKTDRKIDYFIKERMFVKGDPELMVIALHNLLDNAIKYTSKTENPKIEFNYYTENGKNIYFIKDNGAGFEMKYSDKLFNAFQRLHSVDEFPGSGIGLSVVQRIIHRQNGTIWAKSEVGKGACFYFTIE